MRVNIGLVGSKNHLTCISQHKNNILQTTIIDIMNYNYEHLSNIPGMFHLIALKKESHFYV